MRRIKRWQARSAFTLIELVTVICILGIVGAAVGGPTMAYIGSMRARAAAARLASDVRFMQRTALASGLRTWVVINSGANNYQLYAEDPANPGKANRVAVPHPLDQTSGPVQFGTGPFAGVTISSVDVNGGNEVEFDSFGVPYDSSSNALTAAGTIHLSSGVVINVHQVSGFVERTG